MNFSAQPLQTAVAGIFPLGLAGSALAQNPCAVRRNPLARSASLRGAQGQSLRRKEGESLRSQEPVRGKIPAPPAPRSIPRW